MNNKISRHDTKLFFHKVEGFLKNDYESIIEYVTKIQDDISKLDLGVLFRFYCRSINKASLLDKGADYTFQFIYYANQIGKIHFSMAINDGKEIEVQIGSKTVKRLVNFREILLELMFWLKHFTWRL